MQNSRLIYRKLSVKNVTAAGYLQLKMICKLIQGRKLICMWWGKAPLAHVANTGAL